MQARQITHVDQIGNVNDLSCLAKHNLGIIYSSDVGEHSVYINGLAITH